MTEPADEGVAIAVRDSHSWSSLTTRQIREWASRPEAVVVLPIGAIEQHGAHLPVDVDVHIATELALRAARTDGGALVAPALAFGLSASHRRFPGTLSLRTETMLAVVHDLLTSIVGSGFRRILLLNGHNGNAAILGQVAIDVGLETGAEVYSVAYFDLAAETYRSLRATADGGSGHACEFETSIQLALRPDAVGDERDVHYVQPTVAGSFADIVRRGFVARANDLARNYPTGVMGDPSAATSELGEALVEAAVQGLVGLLRDIRSASRASEEDGVGD